MMWKDSNPIELFHTKYLKKWSSTLQHVRAFGNVALQVAGLLMKGHTHCRLAGVLTPVKAGIWGTAWDFAHQVLEPGTPLHPQVATSWATERSIPCLPGVRYPVAALLVLSSISAAGLRFAAGFWSTVPSTAPPCPHQPPRATAAHDRHHSSRQWPGVCNTSDPGVLQHSLRSLEETDCGCNWSVGSGYPAPHHLAA